MHKLARVFFSQIFNAFFPILIVAILLRISNKSEIASVFVILNYANHYLIFSDYSSNIRFVQEAMRIGGIRQNPPPSIIKAIYGYIGIKAIILSIGFIPWLFICYFTPLLHEHFLPALLGYSFIIGYNLNFYWIYTSSNKEFFFIASTFLARVTLVILLFIFTYFSFNFSYLMFYAGIFSIAIALGCFYMFCRIQKIHISLSVTILKESLEFIKNDFKLVANTFSLMSPSIATTFFIGYINNTAAIIVYAFAEKLFLGLRTLLSISINSIYPVLCDNRRLTKKYLHKLLFTFYTTVLFLCFASYFFGPSLLPYVKIPLSLAGLFKVCFTYFLLTIVVLSINVPLMLWLMLSNEIKQKKTSTALFIATGLIITVFIVNISHWKTVISLVQSLLIGESIIALTFLLLYKYRRTDFAPQAIIPTI